MKNWRIAGYFSIAIGLGFLMLVLFVTLIFNATIVNSVLLEEPVSGTKETLLVSAITPWAIIAGYVIVVRCGELFSRRDKSIRNATSGRS
jgi:hypothetical protein